MARVGNVSAFLFLLFSFVIPWLSPTVKRDRRLLLTCWVTLAFRHALALTNAFVTPLSTSWGDLYMFHNIGASLSQGTGQPYGEFLGVIYRAFGVSFWLGEEASVVTYAISLVFFVEIGVMLGVRERLVPCILLFGLLPSPAIHCSVTLRESYQVFGFLGATYALLKLRHKATPWAWPLLGVSLYSVVIMHQSLALFALLVIGLGIPWALQGQGGGGQLVGFLMLTLLPFFLPLFVEKLQSDSATIQALNEGTFLDYAANYRNFINESRSDYGMKVDSSSVPSFVATTLAVVVMYFVAPLPWQVSSTMDYYAFFEVVIRLALLYGCSRQILEARGEIRQRRVMLVLMAMSLEFMWALGTTNWGTAVRHHVVAFGALVLVGLPHYSSFTLDPELAGLLQRRQRRKLAELAV